MPRYDAEGLAALSLCQSVLLALVEETVIDRETVRELLEDAAESHRASDPAGPDRALHVRAARLIEDTVTTLDAVAIRRGRAASIEG